MAAAATAIAGAFRALPRRKAGIPRWESARRIPTLRNKTGGPEGPPANDRCDPCYLLGALILPAAICAEIAFSLAISAARLGAFVLTFP